MPPTYSEHGQTLQSSCSLLINQIDSELTKSQQTGSPAYKNTLAKIKDELSKLDFSKVDASNRQNYERLLASYKLLFYLLKLRQEYLQSNDNGFVMMKNQRNFEASLNVLCDNLLPSLVSSATKSLSDGVFFAPQNLHQRIMSNVVIAFSGPRRSSISPQEVADALHTLGMQDFSGEYFFERPRGRNFSGVWKEATEFVDYAIMYGSGKVKESKSVQIARTTIHDFFKDTSLSIGERYAFYLSLVELFSKSSTLAYKIIAQADGATPKEKLLNAFADFNQTYGNRYGTISLPDANLGALHNVSTTFYSSLQEFKQQNSASLASLFGENPDGKFDAYIDTNFRVNQEGPNKGKYSVDLLNSALARLNTASNYYYSTLISEFAGPAQNGSWMINGRSVQDLNGNNKIDAFELLPVFSEDELKSTASSLFQKRLTFFQQYVSNLNQLINKLKTFNPEANGKEEATSRMAILVSAGFFEEITQETYESLQDKSPAFKLGDKYYQLTEVGKQAINQIDASQDQTKYATAVKQVKDGLDERLISNGKMKEKYAWLGNLILFVKEQLSPSSQEPYWIKGDETKGTEQRKSIYQQSLLDVNKINNLSEEYSPSSIFELAFYNASKQQPDLNLQNHLFYKNGNTQTPRTSEELKALSARLANSELNSQSLIQKIKSFDSGEIQKEENQQRTDQENSQQISQTIPESFLTSLNEAQRLLGNQLQTIRKYLNDDMTIKEEYTKTENNQLVLDESKFEPDEYLRLLAYINLSTNVAYMINKYFEISQSKVMPKSGVTFDSADQQTLNESLKFFKDHFPEQ